MKSSKKTVRVAAVIGAAGLLAGACSSSSKPAATSPTSTGSSGTTSATSGGATKTLTVGIIGDLTGPVSAAFAQMVPYIKDRINKANQTNEVPGFTINTVVDDDQSTPAGELAAAQDLVQNKHVFAVIEADALGFAAYRYLVAQNVPVVAPGFDGPEYGDPANKNLFPVEGSFDPHNHSVTTWGAFFKQVGATKVAVVVDGDSPSATQTAKVINVSLKSAGITGIINQSSTFANSDFTQIATDIKNSGADGVATEFPATQNAALVTALKNTGANMKAILFSTGYGPDTTADAALSQVSQGVYYYTSFPPFEANTAGTQAWSADLQKYANVSGDPGFNAFTGWPVGDLFVTGLKLAGSNPTPASFISALRADTNYNMYNMLPQGQNYTQFAQNTATLAPGNCMFVSRLEGNSFQPVKGDQPLCGSNIPNSNQS
jgi:ABC-type branched-subunit amino acid transport system substrate-binding protein